MTPTKKVQCQACKGRGYIEMYVDEWAETKERFVAGLRRFINFIRSSK